ncbi:MAG: FecR domain-containing protein [Alphaproteobacteria bacterium]|nr:FecR domain-containing protein [Alphaproteobacteria bacterium]
MAYKGSDTLLANTASHSLKIDAADQMINLPDNSYVRDADLVRDGVDLVLEGPHGSLTIEGYFASESAPTLIAPDGTILTPDLVHSFAQSNGEYAQGSVMNDVSPVGAVQEIMGDATIIRTDGTSESVHIGTPVFQGDVIETGADGAVNIMFIDETNFAVSEDARLAIDEFVFDPATNSGAQDFSVLKGVFVFTSGLIGREDPDDVHINTPVGSIGIRGTIIAGDVDSGEITVVEGAIVLRDYNGNEMTLASQFETAKFDAAGGSIENLGQYSAEDIGAKFDSVSDVSPSLFSSIQDAADESTDHNTNAEGSVDQDQDGDVDSTIDAETDGAQNADGGDDVPEGDVPPPSGDTTTNFNVNEFGDSPDGFSDGTQNNSGPEGAMPPPPAGTQTAPPPAGAQPPAGDPPPAPPPPEQPIDPNAGGNDPVFGINITAFAVTEETMGSSLGTIHGVNGDIPTAGNITFTDPHHANFLEIVATGTPGEFEIKLLSGEVIDYDHLKAMGVLNAADQLNVGLMVVSGNGETVNAAIKPHIIAVDEAPQYVDNIPSTYFGAAEASVWQTHFDQDFFDEDYGDSLSYSFSNIYIDATSITSFDDALFNQYLDLTQGGGDGWEFDATTGQMIFFFNNSFTGDHTLTFDITATDLTSMTVSQGYSLDISELDGNIAAGTTFYDGVNNLTYVDDSNSVNTLMVGSSSIATNNEFFLQGGNDTVNLILGSGNSFHLGEGFNTVLIAADANNNDNVFIGGDMNDTMTIQNADNSLFGMGGDDDFMLDANAVSQLQTGGLGSAYIDGGFNDFRAGDVLGALTNPALNKFNPFATDGYTEMGRGDTIALQGGADIDFTAINDSYIRNIERIDVSTDTAANTVTLNYSDVIAMTDGKNTLILNLDSNDTLNFNDLGNTFTKVADDLVVDDARQGDSTSNNVYDVYTDGNVTLLVDVDAGTVTGLPA